MTTAAFRINRLIPFVHYNVHGKVTLILKPWTQRRVLKFLRISKRKRL